MSDHYEASARVSVVIPTIGRDHLRRAVESAAVQDVETEILVVLDRPAKAAAVRLLLDGLDYRLVQTSGSRGASAARNIGLSEASGTHVAYLDDDDWWERGKLRSQLDAVGGAATDGHVCVTASRFHREDGSVIVVPGRPYEQGANIADYVVTRDEIRFGRGFMQTSSVLGTRALMSRFRWDESLNRHEDWDLMIRILDEPGVTFHMVTEPLVHVVQGSTGSLSKEPDWQNSLAWFDRHRGRMGTRARGDFLSVQVLRSALAARSREGSTRAVRELVRTRPHAAAVVVGLFGLIGR
ncbi:glycosyltransferase family 2 protein [Prescottella equi]|uniref:glycosyltransferase family 2 protein n=1 Tax=Rhodococcus hoagii TaxID=43767 RepID=UPI0009C1A82E|nr:glycosyltransferase family 2 protein [Prescottella equi]AVP70177.1 glycosyltransferase family 2 protein [Prescottella equi]